MKFSRLRGWRVTLALAAAILPGALVAQETEGPLVPAGRLRLEFQPAFASWHSRHGPTGGAALGGDLNDPTGARLFPSLLDLEARMRSFLGDLPFDAHLGASSAEVSASVMRLPLRLDVGVRDWLTVGVTVPLVRHRSEIAFSFRADSALANLGVSPAVSRPQEVLAFTAELRARTTAASERAGELCAAAPGDPECIAATQLATTGQQLVTGFNSVYAASPFFLLEGSEPAGVLLERVDAFNLALSELGLPPLTFEPLFATGRLSAGALDALFDDATVDLLAPPLRDRIGLWELGDVELHAAVRLLEGSLGGEPGTGSGTSYQLGVGALVRLGTGRRDDPDVFLDLSGGDGQLDLEGRVFAGLGRARTGLWADLRHGVQRPREVERRIGPPDLVLVPALNRANVEWTPGRYVRLDLVPRFHLTEALAFTASYRYFQKAADSYVRRSGAPEQEDESPLPSPPLFTDAGLLALGTEERSHELGWGLAYSSLDAWERAEARIPFEARFTVRWSVAGAGQAPRGVRSEAGVRLFRTLWGG